MKKSEIKSFSIFFKKFLVRRGPPKVYFGYGKSRGK